MIGKLPDVSKERQDRVGKERKRQDDIGEETAREMLPERLFMEYKRTDPGFMYSWRRHPPECPKCGCIPDSVVNVSRPGHSHQEMSCDGCGVSYILTWNPDDERWDPKESKP